MARLLVRKNLHFYQTIKSILNTFHFNKKVKRTNANAFIIENKLSKFNPYKKKRLSYYIYLK